MRATCRANLPQLSSYTSSDNIQAYLNTLVTSLFGPIAHTDPTRPQEVTGRATRTRTSWWAISHETRRRSLSGAQFVSPRRVLLLLTQRHTTETAASTTTTTTTTDLLKS
jgi:hypothetical protein